MKSRPILEERTGLEPACQLRLVFSKDVAYQLAYLSELLPSFLVAGYTGKMPADPHDWSPRTAFEQRVERSVHDAVMAFWAKIAKSFPAATTGDIDPISDRRFTNQAMDIALEWLETNLPSEKARAAVGDMIRAINKSRE